jgi:threonine/homoserine/homoserine lactone efflux protein
MLSAALALAAAVVVLIAVPGPSIVYIVTQTLTSGRGSAMRAVLGNALGTLTAGILITTFLSQALQRSGHLETVLRVVGCGVLAAIGASYLRKAWRDPPTAAESTVPPRGGTSVMSGWVVGVTNPKVLIIFGAITPGFMPRGLPAFPNLLALSLVPVFVGLVVDSLWVEMSHRIRGRMKNGPSLPWANGVGGVLMLAIAVFLLTEVKV